MLCCIVLCYVVLYCNVLYCVMRYLIELCCVMVCCFVFCVLFCVVLCCVVLCCFVLCCVVLCCVVLYCILLYYRHRRWLFMLTARVYACADFAITEVYQKGSITVKFSAKWLENIFFTPRAFNILYWFLYFKLFKAKQFFLSLYVL